MTTPGWSTACPDWQDRIRSGRSIIPPPIFPEEAEAGLRVFRELKVVDVAGEPTIGEICAPWVFDLAASIFGAYDADTGRRLIRTWYVLVPKKNTKSTIAAAIMLATVIRNWRTSATATILAPTIQIANNSFDPCSDMISHEDELQDLFHVQGHEKKITHLGNGTSLKVIAADSNTVGGSKAGYVLVDEHWLFGKQPKARKMFTEATGGLVSRPEGFVIYLTTQSDEPPAGVFEEKLGYARKVRDGEVIDPTFQPILYEFPPDMVESRAYLDPATWPLVNPNWGRSVDPSLMREKFEEARKTGEGALREWLAKHLNVQIGLSLMGDRWAGADFWEAQGSPEITLDAVIERSEVIEVGIDGGGLDDLLGLAVLGRDRSTGEWLAWGHAWAHPSVMDRRKSEAARFEDFAREGDLSLVERVGDDLNELADIVERCFASGLLKQIGVDPAGIGSIVEAIVERGIPQESIVGVTQGWRLGGAIKTAERRLAEGTLKHGGRPMMAWCVGNARIEPRANSILITKQASGTAKIDPLMALLCAVELMSRCPESDVIDSNYELMVA